MWIDFIALVHKKYRKDRSKFKKELQLILGAPYKYDLTKQSPLFKA